MNGQILFITLIASILIFIALSRYSKQRKRRKIMSQETPKEWDLIIKRNIPIYEQLPKELQERLLRLMKVFVAEKNFEGCGGLKITEEIKVTIAAQACLLVLNRRSDLYPNLDSILVYPSSYSAKDIEPVTYGTYIVKESARIGESWKHGIVVLAWDHVKNGALEIDDGHNVVLHEFAHQLDSEPSRPSSYITWARILCREFQKLKKNIEKDSEFVLDDYGATNQAEFFAVITESFFEKALLMKKKHPALYKMLKDYYKLDPSKWMEEK